MSNKPLSLIPTNELDVVSCFSFYEYWDTLVTGAVLLVEGRIIPVSDYEILNATSRTIFLLRGDSLGSVTIAHMFDGKFNCLTLERENLHRLLLKEMNRNVQNVFNEHLEKEEKKLQKGKGNKITIVQANDFLSLFNDRKERW